MDITARRLKKTIYNSLPDFYQEKIEREAGYAKIEDPQHIVFITYSIFAAILLAFILLFQGSTAVKIGLLAMALPIIGALPYLLFSLLANKRRKEVEAVLPDALQLISANIQSGLTIEKAFLLSARDEFGPLAVDLKQTAMDMFGGTPVDEALAGLSERTNSELFQETLTLLQDSIESGGKVSQLLESSAQDIQKSLELREEIGANVKMYSLFIMMASVVGAPVLFSVSVFLTERTSEMWGSQSIDFSSLPETGVFTFKEPSFRPEFFADFALISIIISNVFAALIISEIKNGSVKEGIKLVPITVIVSLIIFFVTSTAIKMALGGLA